MAEVFASSGTSDHRAGGDMILGTVVPVFLESLANHNSALILAFLCKHLKLERLAMTLRRDVGP